MRKLVVVAAVITLLFSLTVSAEARDKGSLIDTITTRLGIEKPTVGVPAIAKPNLIQ